METDQQRGHGRRRRFLVALASCVACLVLSELALKLLIRDGVLLGVPLPPFDSLPHPRQAEWLERQRAELGEPTGRSVFDAELGWTNRTTDSPDSAAPFIDAVGARSVREGESTDSAEVELWAFGDSFTFCSEVEDDETWPYFLDHANPELSVKNFGVSGYGTDQALLRFRRKKTSGAATIVCIGILTENIGRNVNRYRPLYYPRTESAVAKPRFVLREDQLELVPMPYRSRVELLDAVEDGSVLDRTREHEFWYEPDPPAWRISSLSRLYFGWRAYMRRRQSKPLWSDTSGEPYRVTIALLETFRTEALASGAELAPIIIFPRKEDFASFVESGSRAWETLREELERQEIDFIDVADALLSKYRESPGSAYVDSHFCAEANAIIADAVGSYIRSSTIDKDR